ncbi:nSTAND1 domain-containing NTPase [Amycolatopsis kentuckyensis]|uniref:nSTAND1 domain-containing NTPase n=1 Tax=Amycolatopsis kentuckyensis TaxID=218823 RepID=UPI001FC8FD88|nr:hypothetical protein [Amycolatopsis kentuckyensis]
MPRGERPLAGEDGVVLRFARDLRLLREKAGRPTYRELGARAHYSAAALSEAAGGRKLPTLAVTIAYVAACDGDTAEWTNRWRACAAELAAANAEPAGENDRGRAPYPGLAAFERADADRFFGRDDLVADLVTRLDRRRFLGVFGPSGCGKSSVLRAGLAAHERDGPVVVFTPGERPFEECAVRLAPFLGESPATLRDEFAEDPRNLHLRLRQAATGGDFVLVVDQFEELFTLCGDEPQRGRFIDALVTAATDPASRTRVVIGVRADFLGHCGRHHRLVSALRDAQVLVGPMSVDELRQAITGPAERAGYRLETALVARLAGDAARQAGFLPLVSHALLQTWLRRQGAVMTVAGYEAAGGIEHALARSAEETYQAFDPGQRHTAQQIFLRLTALGEGTEDTKRRTTLEELDLGDPGAVAVLDTLARARLITLGDNSAEIAHEALIRHWPRLRTWLTEDRDGYRIHRRLTEAASEWDRHDRDAGLLYRGARLDAWEGRSIGLLNDTERTFLTASRDAAERERRARRRRIRFTVGGLSSAVVIVTVLAVVALVMAARADDQRKLAQGRQLIADARAQLQVDPELGLLLAREAYRTAPSEEAEAVLRQATVDSHIRTTLAGSGAEVDPQQSRSFGGAVFTPDGKYVVASEGGVADGTLQVRTWDPEHGMGAITRTLRTASPLIRPVFSADGRRLAAFGEEGVWVWEWEKVLAGQAQPVARHPVEGLTWRVRVALSSDGRRVAVGGGDGAVRVWNAIGDDQPAVLRGDSGRVLGVAFSRDGKWLAGGGEDGTVRLWNLADGGSSVALRGHEGSAEAVAFSPDGRHLASAGVDGTIRVWDLAHPPEAVVLGRHDGGILDVAYSADGSSIASAGDDSTVEIWNTGRAVGPTVLRGHRGVVWSVAFSPDGRSVASVAFDGSVKTWAVDPVEDLVVFRGHQGQPATPARSPYERPEVKSPVVGVAASADGRLVVSGGQDGTVRIWQVSGGRTPMFLAGNGKPVVHVAVSPSGKQVAAVYEGGAVDIWKTGNPAAPTRLQEPYPGNPALEVSFRADGNRLVGFTADGMPYIWSTPEDSVAEPVPEPFPGGALTGASVSVGWSPDGRHIAATVQGAILVWDLDVRRGLTELPGDARRIRTLAFSADGAHVAGGTDDGTVRLWNIADPAHPTGPVTLRGRHEGAVRGMTFSQDSRRLITVGTDATVRIWNTTGTSEPLVFNAFRAAASGIASLADGRYVTAHDDGAIRVWRCLACGPVPDLLAEANRHVTRELTAEERRTYLPASR